MSELTEQGATSARSPEERLELLARLRGRIPFEHVDFSRLEADILFALGASAQAHDRISRLAAEGDFDADALLDLANKAETLGWRRLARSLVAAAAERDPDHPGVRSSRAILAISEGHLDDAERLLREDLARDPDRARTHRLLSQVHAARDETEAALRHGRRAVELAPWQEDWRALLVELLDSLGHGAEARRVREGAPRPEPTS